MKTLMAAAIALQILFALKRMTKNWSGCEWNEHNIFLTKWSVLFCQICDEAIVSFPGIYSNSIQFSISKIEDGEGLNWDLFPCLSRSCIMKKAFSDSWRSLLLTKCISDDMVYWGTFHPKLLLPWEYWTIMFLCAEWCKNVPVWLRRGFWRWFERKCISSTRASEIS